MPLDLANIKPYGVGGQGAAMAMATTMGLRLLCTMVFVVLCFSCLSSRRALVVIEEPRGLTAALAVHQTSL
ncbi:hypothetical protein UMZ34_25315 [Halopseudomonas pachastrellae]|nr:hypothetical protein UMZ34_25315 [Halopseudomonas pachastrellae]